MLYFIQHIPIMAGLVKKMLYFVQDFAINEKFLAETAAIRSSNAQLPHAQVAPLQFRRGGSPP